MAEGRQKYIQMLEDAGIRPSLQRLIVLEHISMRRDHPDADEVYSTLVKDNPTLSRTTVFNCLKLFAACGLVNSIDISADATRYDTTSQAPHAHFMCRRCGRIFDLPLDMSTLGTPAGFVSDNVNVFYKGLCPECNGKETENSNKQ